MAKTLETRSECTNATEHMLNMFEIRSTNPNAFFSCSHWPGNRNRLLAPFLIGAFGYVEAIRRHFV